MYSLYKIHKDKLLLNPRNGKPFKTMLSIRNAVINKMHAEKVGGKYAVFQSDIDKWNECVRFINGQSII